jgi:hypothetical protein
VARATVLGMVRPLGPSAHRTPCPRRSGRLVRPDR